MNADDVGDGPTDRLTVRQLAIIVFVAVPLVVLGLPIVIAVFVGRGILGIAFVCCRYLALGVHGRDVLVVYSNSPHWQRYFEDSVIPSIGERASVLNWSERSRWPRFGWRVTAFRWFAGHREFNPIVIVFKNLRWPRCFRFYRAMHDAKHRNFASVHRVVGELSDYLGQQVPPPDIERAPS